MATTLTVSQYNVRDSRRIHYVHNNGESYTEIEGALYRVVGSYWDNDTRLWVHTLELVEFTLQVEHVAHKHITAIYSGITSALSNPAVSATIAIITLLLGIIVGITL